MGNWAGLIDGGLDGADDAPNGDGMMDGSRRGRPPIGAALSDSVREGQRLSSLSLRVRLVHRHT